MDWRQLNDQFNDALNRWWQALVEYFSNLNRMEQYGWAGFCSGLLLFIVGIFLL